MIDDLISDCGFRILDCGLKKQSKKHRAKSKNVEEESS
jgi:hypothetical protein